MSMTRKMRLWGGVGGLVALVSLCSGLGVWYIHTTAATTRTLIATGQVEREAAYEAEISLLRARSAEQTFLQHNNKKLSLRTLADITRAKTQLQRLQQISLDPTRRQQAARASELVEAYQAVFQQHSSLLANTRTQIETIAHQLEQQLTVLKQTLSREISNTEKNVLGTLSFITPLLLALFGASISIGPVVAFFSIQSFSRPIDRLVASVQALAEGDLTARVGAEDAQQKDELGQIGKAVNILAQQLHDGMTQVTQAASAVVVSAEQLSTTTKHLAAGTQEQASSLEHASVALQDITGTVKQNADSARQANQLAVGSCDVAEKGQQVVMTVVTSMDQISTASKQITDTISVIDEITFQTNLLALNASVEAARAGEQGRGFAVVAAEVGNLAQRSATAAKAVKALVQNSGQKVADGLESVDKSGKTLGEIVSSVKQVTDLIGEIAGASDEQATGIAQMSQMVARMDQVVHANWIQTKELSATSQSMSLQAQQLQTLVGRFKLNPGDQPSQLGKPNMSDRPSRTTNTPEQRLPGIRQTQDFPSPQSFPKSTSSIVPPHNTQGSSITYQFDESFEEF